MRASSDLSLVSVGFLADGGEAGALMRGLDWSTSPLGHPGDWPQSLRSVVGLMLTSRFPMFVAWGDELGFLYNDAYAAILGAKHPRAMGRRFQDIWSEIWGDISPLIDSALAGEATFRENLPLVMRRSVYDEQTWFTFSYSPVRDESGRVAGMFCACTETTDQVLAARRETFLSRLSEALISVTEPAEIMATATAMLGRHLGANRVGYGQVQADDATVVLDACYADGVASLAGPFPLDGFGAQMILCQRRGLTQACDDVLADPAQDHATWSAINTRAFVSVPLIREGRFTASLYANFREPYRWTAAELALIEDVGGRTWSAVERAKAEAELRDSAGRLDRAHRAARLGDFTWDVATDAITLSGEYPRLLGLAPDALPRAAPEFLELIHPGDRARVEAEAAPMLAGQPVRFDTEYRLVRGDGETVWIAASAESEGQLADGRAARVVGVNYDVTERRQAVEAVSESEARLRLVQRAGGIGSFDYDLQKDDAVCSPEYYAILGLPEGHPITRETWTAAIHPGDRHKAVEALDRAIAERAPFDYEYRIVRADDGEVRWLSGRAAVLFDADGRPWRYVGGNIDVTPRHEAEAAVRESEQELQLLADSLPVLVSYVDRDQRYRFNNQAYEQWFGRPREEVAGRTMREVLGDAAHQALRPQLERALAGETVTFESVVPYKDGGSRHIEASYIPRRSADGSVAGFYALVADISERRRAEGALRESEERFRNMADHAPVMMWVTDQEARCTYLNRAWYEFTGQTPRQAEGFAWVDAVHPDDRGWSGESFLAANAKREAFRLEYRLRRHDGEYRWAIDAASPRFGAQGEFLGYIGSCVDVTDARRAREQLERLVTERTAERDRIWQMSHDLFAVMGFDGFLKAVNPAWETTLGFDETTLLNRPFPEQVHPDDHAGVRAAVERLLRGEAVAGFEDRLRHADGSWRWISWNLVPETGAFYAVGRDVTADKERQAAFEAAQEQLRQAQKMEAVGQLTGGVAHDFNNLLTIIKSSTDLLRRPDLAEERRRRYVDAISETVDRASKLTGQLLAFARRQALQPEVFDAGERIGAVAEMLSTIMGSRITIATEITAVPCFVQADVSQFETALVNMAVNARDAMNGEGTLTIQVQDLSRIPPIRSNGGGTGQFVAISLADTGSGIPVDKLVQVFEPFYTTKEVGKGTGLGLSQVYGFAKQSGGDVAVQSEIGRGTTFTLYLARVEAPTHKAREGGDARRPVQGDTGDGRRVLVVEDNIEVGRFSTQLLQDLGYETTWAANADEALRLLAEVGGFDAVFSDVVMPGMSGVELGQEIRRRHPGLPVVLTSGYSHVLAEHGRHGFELLQKPYAVEDLSRVLRRVARDKPLAAPAEART